MTTRPLTILLANSGRRWIGEVAHVAMLYEQLEALGHRPWIICRAGMALHQRAAAAGWRHRALTFSSDLSPLADWRDAREWSTLTRETGADVIHCHRGKDHWMGVAVARWTGRPLVRTRHVVLPVRRHPFNWWLYHRATAAVISVSGAVRAGFGPWADTLPGGHVIYSVIDNERFRPERRSEAWRMEHASPAWRARAGAGEQPLWFGLVGRFQRIKGQRYFMEAAGEVARALPQAHFLMAGAGGDHYREKFMQYAIDGGFSDRVLILDLIDYLPEVLASLDVGVLASLGSEGSSRIGLELLASGTPIVATKVGSLPELAGQSDGAIRLVEPRSGAALAAGMLAWVRDPEARVAGMRGRDYVTRERRPAEWGERMVAIYRSVLNKGGH